MDEFNRIWSGLGASVRKLLEELSSRPDKPLNESVLLSEEHAATLKALMGPEQYAHARSLAEKARVQTDRSAGNVIIVPGFMACSIGTSQEVIWMNLRSIIQGDLIRLALNGQNPDVGNLGVMSLGYILLKLQLELAGFSVQYFSYDWRKSFAAAGAELTRFIEQQNLQKVSLVAHSMGGLVARAAIAQGNQRIDKLVMLGTPNYGSFITIPSIRGTFLMVKMLAALDLKHTAQQLAEQVVATWPGIYEMMPSPDKFPTGSFYSLSGWPDNPPRPEPLQLQAALEVQRSLAGPGQVPFYLIAGVNVRTLATAAMNDGKLQYTYSNAGDTVSLLASAQMDKMPTYYADGVTHANLPYTPSVNQAAAELLLTGTAQSLPGQCPPIKSEQPGALHEVEESFVHVAKDVATQAATLLKHGTVLPGSPFVNTLGTPEGHLPWSEPAQSS
nr:hypothetical protein [Cystobacter sp.]